MSLPVPELPVAKLPLPLVVDADSTSQLAKFSSDVIVENVKNVRSSSAYIRRSFITLYCMYVALFLIGVATAILAVMRGFTAQSPEQAAGSLAIAGLSAASFFAVFITRPLEALERNSIHSAWLTAVTNTYWTRLMYFSDPRTIEHDLTAATSDLVADLSKLSDKHSSSRPTGD